LNWWRKYKIRQHYSLDSVTENEDGTPQPLTEMVIGELDWERRIDGKVDAEQIWNKLPQDIKPIVLKRLISQSLTKQEHNKLSYWVKAKGYQLLLK
jgi:hypothetical protein